MAGGLSEEKPFEGLGFPKVAPQIGFEHFWESARLDQEDPDRLEFLLTGME